jgi:redox-sensing transcriptional repressor
MKTNQRSISRLSRYRDTLLRFKSYDVQWVYSEQIASALGITAAQVRKDFSHFGVTGKRKIGYHIDIIMARLNRILGKNNESRAVIAGFGPFGRVLYKEYFSREQGIRILAAFDEDRTAETRDDETGLPVLPMDRLIGFASTSAVRFGIIATPGASAQAVLDRMVLSGIAGILNLSGVELKGPKSCFVNSVSVIRELQNVVFFGNGRTKTGRAA